MSYYRWQAILGVGTARGAHRAGAKNQGRPRGLLEIARRHRPESTCDIWGKPLFNIRSQNYNSSRYFE